MSIDSDFDVLWDALSTARPPKDVREAAKAAARRIEVYLTALQEGAIPAMRFADRTDVAGRTFAGVSVVPPLPQARAEEWRTVDGNGDPAEPFYPGTTVPFGSATPARAEAAPEREGLDDYIAHGPEGRTGEPCPSPGSWQHALGTLRYRHANIEGSDPLIGAAQRICAMDRQTWPCSTVEAIDTAAGFLAARLAPTSPSSEETAK